MEADGGGRGSSPRGGPLEKFDVARTELKEVRFSYAARAHALPWSRSLEDRKEAISRLSVHSIGMFWLPLAHKRVSALLCGARMCTRPPARALAKRQPLPIA